MVSTAHREFAIELARASGELIRSYFARRDLALDLKTDGTIVTAADRGSEKVMREMINRQFPEHGIVGEELGSERPDAEYVWVLDPVDGTVSFASGVPLFGSLIALKYRGHSTLGIIHQPIKRMSLGRRRQYHVQRPSCPVYAHNGNRECQGANGRWRSRDGNTGYRF